MLLWVATHKVQEAKAYAEMSEQLFPRSMMEHLIREDPSVLARASQRYAGSL